MLGAGLIAGGLSLLVTLLVTLSRDSVDMFVVLVGLVCAAPSLAIVYFGILHIRRALVGRQSASRY